MQTQTCLGADRADPSAVAVGPEELPDNDDFGP
jgi:hypothetical protein